ncbi:hypothetical protein L596_015211 [Steinernema carpocapsae]|uniref:Uncharacterized protein n=1 Tax=Steinernema carpocapsae TaxID=34508 RepID=A0A4U5NEI8_STECR|nr:hypothetical protein L596_015211 [Steinernema carpocapsae]
MTKAIFVCAHNSNVNAVNPPPCANSANIANESPGTTCHGLWCPVIFVQQIKRVKTAIGESGTSGLNQ